MAVNPIDSYFGGVGTLEYICTVQKADHPIGWPSRWLASPIAIGHRVVSRVDGCQGCDLFVV